MLNKRATTNSSPQEVKDLIVELESRPVQLGAIPKERLAIDELDQKRRRQPELLERLRIGRLEPIRLVWHQNGSGSAFANLGQTNAWVARISISNPSLGKR